MDDKTLKFKQAPKRYGMSASAMTEGFECEDCETAAGAELIEEQAEGQKYTGFVKRNNYADRI